MHNILPLLAATSIFLLPIFAGPLAPDLSTKAGRTAARIARGKERYALYGNNHTARRNTPYFTRPSFLVPRTNEPTTGEDEWPDTDPHPNALDKVETAFNDAFELCAYVIDSIDDDIDIFPHYFNGGDRAGVKNVFVAILGTVPIPDDGPTGNELLSNIGMLQSDPYGLCPDGRTLAYAKYDTDSPYMTLCPNAFNKKAVTLLNGADPQTDPQYYQDCASLGTTVSYRMNHLGVTLLHEYTHYDDMLEYIFGASIIDQEDANGNPIGYGPVAVYDSLDKSLAPFNADSYAYFATHTLWSVLCQQTFDAPIAGQDDEDPDCGNAPCQEPVETVPPSSPSGCPAS